jgi:hypothetical protein
MADLLQESGLTVTDATGAILIQGATDKRMTVLSIHICNTHASNDETFSLYRTDLDGSSNPKFLYHTQSLPALSTFVVADKIVLGATTELWCASPSASADIDVHASYLEQDV